MRRRSTWSARDMLIEAVRNVAAVRSRAAMAALIGIILGTLVGLWLGQSAESYQRESAAESLSGTQVVTVGSETDPRGPLLSRASCESLHTTGGVVASGVYHTTAYRWFPPLGEVAVVEASSSLIDFGGRDLLLGDGLYTPGRPRIGHLIDDTGATYSYAVAPRQPVGIELNGSVIVGASPSARTRTCVIRLDTGVQVEGILPVLLAQLDYAGEGAPAVVAKPGSGEAARRYLASSDRVALVVGGLILGLCVGLFRRLRASEAISYRLSGASVAQLMVIQAAEDLVCGALASATALAMLVVLPGDPRLLLAQVLWACACTAAYSWGLITAGLLVVLPRPTRLALV